MTSTYIFQNDDSFWGDNVTRDEAERLGDIQAQLAGEEFPEIKFESRFNISEHQAGFQEKENPELEEEIKRWLSSSMGYNPEKVYEHPDMVWDIREIIEDNAGGLHATYGNGDSCEIKMDQSPEDLETSEGLDLERGDYFKENKVVWSARDGWADFSQMGCPGHAGREYCATHCEDASTLRDLAEMCYVEQIEINGEYYDIWSAGSLWTIDPTEDCGVKCGHWLGFKSSREEAIDEAVRHLNMQIV